MANLSLANLALAQTPLGGLNVDPTTPIEMSADQLTINQDGGTAIFDGNALIKQGDMRLAADRVHVTYAEGGQIAQLDAQGNVTLVTETDAAEAQSAIYSLADETLVMRGDVLVTQGQNAMMADEFFVDLAKNTSVLNGNVRTVLVPQDAAQ